MDTSPNTLSQDFLELMNKKKPKRKDTVVALYKVTQALEGVVVAIKDIQKTGQATQDRLTEHEARYWQHIEEDNARVNKGKGAWRVLVWAVGIIQVLVLGVGGAFYTDYASMKNRVIQVEKTQAAQLAVYPIRKRRK